MGAFRHSKDRQIRAHLCREYRYAENFLRLWRPARQPLAARQVRVARLLRTAYLLVCAFIRRYRYKRLRPPS